MTVTVTVVLKYNRSSYRNISLFSTTVAAMPKCSSVNNEHKNILLLPAFNVQAPSDISSQNVWDNNNWQDYEQHKYSYC